MARAKRRPVAVDQSGPLRGCGYYRVSTGRQAEGELSIPDQQKQVHAYFRSKGWEFVDDYVEGGSTATDDGRLEFQRMIERALDDDHPFDVIAVHSYSRFMRDSFLAEMYVRKLAKAGVKLISITQELGDDPHHVMFRKLIALFDEYQSQENAKHVLRAMKENASQGFYNGSPVPLGFRVEEVEKRGIRLKKRLVEDPVESDTIRLIFRLYMEGHEALGPMGVKKIAVWLNGHGYRTRKGGLFGVSAVHTILTNRIYIGEGIFNKRSSKTLRAKPDCEHVPFSVPAIIDSALFLAVQEKLKERDPRSVAPRVVTGPILLTGLAVCADCGGAMTLRTGTSGSGKVYEYYTCSTCARKGKTACKGRSIRMDKLDDLVVDHLVHRLFEPDRLRALLSSVLARREQREAEIDERVSALESEIADASEKLKRLYRIIEEGDAEPDDILRARIAELRRARDRATATADRIAQTRLEHTIVDPGQLETFSRQMRANLTSGPIPFRKAYIQAVVDHIEVGDNTIRIVGHPSTLERAISTAGNHPAVVRRSVPKWRARNDSNVRPPDS